MRDVVTLLMPITPTRWKENINSRTNHLFSEASKPDASVIQLLTIIKLNRTHRLLSISLKLLAQYLLAVNDVPSSSCEASFNGSRVIRPPKRIIPSDAKKYAVKQRIFENLYLNGEDVVQKLQLIEQRLKAARNYALSIVNTPNFAEMKGLWMANRRAQYSKYYDMFKSFNYNSMRIL